MYFNRLLLLCLLFLVSPDLKSHTAEATTGVTLDLTQYLGSKSLKV